MKTLIILSIPEFYNVQIINRTVIFGDLLSEEDAFNMEYANPQILEDVSLELLKEQKKYDDSVKELKELHESDVKDLKSKLSESNDTFTVSPSPLIIGRIIDVIPENSIFPLLYFPGILPTCVPDFIKNLL